MFGALIWWQGVVTIVGVMRYDEAFGIPSLAQSTIVGMSFDSFRALRVTRAVRVVQ